ncbi:MAG: cupin domain-containing protein [Dehalococcoidales bacterium]|nr:cupin domain-containing protein [Dehalococcoidales bacterium]MDZ4230189.1 cupin domain-containing protein [Dehalococcoidales bacterium]
MQRREEHDAGFGGQVYEQWMEKEGIPVYQSIIGVEDITELPRRPWARLGGAGTYIELEGTKQARKGLYVAEIPPGKALEPERHIYDELLYIAQGRGLAEVWQEGGPKHSFEWGEGALFATPLNVWHRFVNGGREPVIIFAQTSAPLAMTLFRDAEFVFNCPVNFTDRYSGEADYFAATDKVSREQLANGETRGTRWETNFVPDLRAVVGNYDSPWKVEGGGRQSYFRMAAWTSAGSSIWPVGVYHKAHYHGPGAILLGLNSEGYVLLWHRQYGIHPYQDGHGDEVIKMNWKNNSIYVPPTEWFHQHFNTGKEPARQLRVTGGGLGIELPTVTGRRSGEGGPGIRQGGTVIGHEDEDPQIRRDFQEALKQNGIEFAMNPVVYRTDPVGRIV